MKTLILFTLLTFTLLLSSVTGQQRQQNSIIQSQVERPGKQHPIMKNAKIYERMAAANRMNMNKTNSTDAQLDRFTDQYLHEEDWIDNYRVDFIYQNGHRTEESFSSWNGTEWTGHDKFLYKYTNNLLTEKSYQYNDQDSFVNVWRDLYSYQESNGVTLYSEVLWQEWEDGNWVDEGRVLINASNGVITDLVEEYWDGDQWVAEWRLLFDQDGDNLVETEQEWDGSEWVSSYRYVYPNLTMPEFYDIVTSFDDFIFFNSYLYLERLFPDYIEQFWDGTEWISDYRSLSEKQTEGGKLQSHVKTTSYSENGTDWIDYYRFVYQYDADEFLITADEEYFETDGWVTVYGEEFQYDESDLLTIILRKHSDEYYKSAGGDMSVTGRTVLEWSGGSVSIENPEVPVTHQLGAAYPNPFNPSAVVPYRIANAGHVTIRVFDVLGRPVMTLVNGHHSAGEHMVRFDGSNLSSGVYIIRLETPGFNQIRSVTLLK